MGFSPSLSKSITTAFFVAKGIIYRLKSRLSFWHSDDGASRSALDTGARIILYREGGQYASSVRPLLVELDHRGITCTLLSSDPKDPLWRSPAPRSSRSALAMDFVPGS